MCTRLAIKAPWRYVLEVLALLGGAIFFVFGACLPCLWGCLVMPLGRATGAFAPLPADGDSPQPATMNGTAPAGHHAAGPPAPSPAAGGIQMGHVNGYERFVDA